MFLFQRSVRALALIGIVSLAVTPSGSNAADTAPYEILSMLPLTGGGAFQGREQLRTLQVLEEYINKNGGIKGRPVKFNIVDTQGNPQLAVQVMNDAAAKKDCRLCSGRLSPPNVQLLRRS